MEQELLELKAKIYDLQKDAEQQTQVLNELAGRIAEILEINTSNSYTADQLIQGVLELKNKTTEQAEQQEDLETEQVLLTE